MRYPSIKKRPSWILVDSEIIHVHLGSIGINNGKGPDGQKNNGW